MVVIPGLRFCRLVFVGGLNAEGFTLGPVDPRRQLAMCIWEDEPALERFLERSPVARAWRERSDEYCELRLTPFRAHGSYLGREPLAGMAATEHERGPVVVWTFANIPPRSLRFFWGGIRHATRELFQQPGLIAGTAGPERLYTGAMTFTVWESLRDTVRFAYRERPHKQIVKRVNDRGLLTDSMFIRFRPYAAGGAWPARSRFAARFETFARSLQPEAGRDRRLTGTAL